MRRAHVMHIEAEMVRGAVHEIFLHQRLIRTLLAGLSGGEQSQPDELALHQLDDLFLIFHRRVAGAENLICTAENPQHRVVNSPLTLGEFSVHRHRAR